MNGAYRLESKAKSVICISCQESHLRSTPQYHAEPPIDRPTSFQTLSCEKWLRGHQISYIGRLETDSHVSQLPVVETGIQHFTEVLTVKISTTRGR